MSITLIISFIIFIKSTSFFLLISTFLKDNKKFITISRENIFTIVLFFISKNSSLYSLSSSLYKHEINFNLNILTKLSLSIILFKKKI